MQSFRPQAAPVVKTNSNKFVIVGAAGVASLVLLLMLIGVGTFLLNNSGIPVVEPGKRVLIIEDNDKRLTLTEAQKDAIQSNADDSIRGIVRKAEGEFVLINLKNQDVSKASPGIRELFELWDKHTVPWFGVVNNRSAFVGPLDDTSKGTVKRFFGLSSDTVEEKEAENNE